MELPIAIGILVGLPLAMVLWRLFGPKDDR